MSMYEYHKGKLRRTLGDGESSLFGFTIDMKAMARTFAFVGTANLVGKKTGTWEELVWFVVVALSAHYGWN